ncbi:MAG: cytochrome C [Elusimicrobia bacterium]|nr:cytochrome C [Elusimicrobiota bacterium]
MLTVLYSHALLAGALCLAAAPAKAKDCQSCHPAVFSQAHTHGPVGVKMCAVCHVNEKPAAGKHHTFGLAKDGGPELCFSCHDTMRAKFDAVKVKHAAIDAGGCTGCHDPHGSPQKFFLKGKTMAQTCGTCHDQIGKGAVVHPPVKQSCALCHEPHGGANEHLLTQKQPGLCLDCHEGMRAALNGKHVHKPVATGCASCHDPHSAAKPMLVKADPKKELCLGCHSAIAKHLKGAKYPHGAIAQKGCVGCHTPHTSDQAAILKAPMKTLCAGCHEEKKAELKNPFLHGPVAQNQCQGCHDPHGAPNPNILKAFFPPEFYNPYKDGLYALCFNCHETDIARESRTRALTNFRDGDRNLHYLHVHAEKGRSCKACHQAHASSQAKHIRSSVPFGSWKLPIDFKKTEIGGTCVVGCHNPKTYARAQASAAPAKAKP